MTSRLPWVILADGAHIVDPNAWTVARCYGDAADKNARLIVTAVNSHAELLAAAKDLVKLVEGTNELARFANEATIPARWINSLKAAIAKAEEIEP